MKLRTKELQVITQDKKRKWKRYLDIRKPENQEIYKEKRKEVMIEVKNEKQQLRLRLREEMNYRENKKSTLSILDT